MIYIVKSGDTVDSIADREQIFVETLIYDNQIPYPYQLAVGQALYIEENNQQEERKRIESVNGYAYPFINRWTLEQTLPYLTELSVFSYGFTLQGNLIPPLISDQFMISAAYQYGVRPILTLTPFDESGNFNNYLIHQLVNNEDVINQLISQLLFVMREKGFSGVDIDFEFILPMDRDAFTDFVAKVTKAVNEEGFTASVALAPKISTEQKGLLYEGKDYGGLGAAANSVLLMTYEWGYTYGPPMAVAPINQVKRVIDYAVTQIKRDKISIGIPNYGYDWTLPFTTGVTKARTIGNVEAVQLAIYFNATIQFDEVAMSPYFFYTDDIGLRHEVWFEDVRSLQQKFRLVSEYNLRGVGYWQIMQFFRANWLLLESMLNKN